MKTNFILIAIGLLLFASCKPDDPTPDSEIIRQTTNRVYKIGDGEVYTQDLGVSDLTDVTITTAPKNASLNEITSENSSLVYRYQPIAGYLGNDTTSIETCVTYEDGACINYKNYNIFFEVIEPTQFNVIGDTCSVLLFQKNAGSNFEEGLAELETIRASDLGNTSYITTKTEITVKNPVVGRTYFAITFKLKSDETDLFSTRDVIDSEGNYFGIAACPLN